MSSSLNKTIISKIVKYEEIDGHIFVTAEDGGVYYEYSKDKKYLGNFIERLKLIKKNNTKTIMEIRGEKLLKLITISCKALEYYSEDEHYIRVTYGIAPGVFKIDKSLPIMNDYNRLKDILIKNSKNNPHTAHEFSLPLLEMEPRTKVEFAIDDFKIIYLGDICGQTQSKWEF